MSYKNSVIKRQFRKMAIVAIFISIMSSSIFGLNPYDYPVKTIFIDPGHGGKDAGASRDYDFIDYTLNEKDINLALANKVSSLLQSYYIDINVYQTRVNDEFLSLWERSQVCPLTPLPPKTSCLYVSLHVNASENEDASGFEVFTKLPPSEKKLVLFDSNTPTQNIPFFTSESNDDLNDDLFSKSVELANNINNSISSYFPDATNRGVKNDNLYVLNVSKTPAVLIEIAFLSNKDEAKNLIDDDYLNEMAFAIFEGISKSL
jgi:N-acetylmuramoyl-L-alanine amidase